MKNYKNSEKIILKKYVILFLFYYCILINIGWYFYTVKIQSPVLKYPVFIKTSKIFKIKNVFLFKIF